ncbi:MAG TPA: Xaa-Pro peptidase family protein [Gaiellaceae bacterium]|nr:Xaa-Pro peptidase family protein [Gaiellaceae bacterium]
MTDVLIYGDTVRSSELRHELPIGIPDPVLYAERNGTRHVLTSSMEAPRLAELGGLELHLWEELGWDELVAQGLDRAAVADELLRRAVAAFEVRSAVVPESFPLRVADLLRADGVELRVDRDYFDDRRRVKSEAELAGMRRAQRAAEAGMDAARDLLRRADSNGGALEVDGEPLTSERIKRAIARTFVDHGAASDEFIVSHGPQSAIGHHMGAGEIREGEPIVIDLWPRDGESACFADMTRTFVVGEPPAEIAEWHRLVLEALERSTAAVREGAGGRAVYDVACDVFEPTGLPTGRTKRQGAPLEEGFFHGLGHGVGLDVHEEPFLGLTSKDVLRAGDVVTIEPGLYRPGLGGVRLEDLVLVTADGAENLTSYPYDLAP